MDARVLVVDDSPIVQKIHKFFLEQAGYQVDIADCAETALTLQPNRYQVIFLDLNLPGITGIELAIEIRRREQQFHKKIPLIGISSAANEAGKAADCLSAGINELIAKPVTAKQIQAILQRWVVNN